jgi:hypothetical protein
MKLTALVLDQLAETGTISFLTNGKHTGDVYSIMYNLACASRKVTRH